MKLWQKQKKGKENEKLGKGRADIPHDVFIKMMQVNGEAKQNFETRRSPPRPAE